MNEIMAITGMIGGLLCAAADCLLDIKGADNRELGKGRYINSKWSSMAHWRFTASGILPVPIWYISLNPVVFQLVGLLLRATKLKCFVDVPSICAASLGLAMYGVIALAIL